MRSSTVALPEEAEKTPERSRLRPLVPPFAAALFSCVFLASLGALPYSTSRISRVDEEQVLASPALHYKLGPLTWDLDGYVTAPQLARFRDTFKPVCGHEKGLLAARCVSDYLSARSPRGEPGKEFVDEDYEPSRALKQHLDGEPGHCTVRASMTASALLAMGVPARVVQVIPPAGRGHNLLEVWDDQQRWVLFDPYFDSSMLHEGRFMPALTLATAAGGLSWRRPHDDSPDPNLFAGATIQYPEPWLYTRVGERCSRWPFRGCFAQVGPRQLLIGPAQQFALAASLVFALSAFVLAWRALRTAQ